MKQIGKTFADELKAAGLLELPFAWSDDGTINFDDRMTEEQKAAVRAVYASHNPTAGTVPQSVTRFQGRMALLQEGHLDMVEAAVAAAGRPTQLAYEAGTWERNSQFVLGMASGFGWTPEYVDSLFILADSL